MKTFNFKIFSKHISIFITSDKSNNMDLVKLKDIYEICGKISAIKYYRSHIDNNITLMAARTEVDKLAQLNNWIHP